METHVAELKERLGETGTELHPKPDYQVWWNGVAAMFVHGLFLLIHLLTFGRVEVDFDDFWTTLGGVVYAPRDHEVDLEDPEDFAVVCHELAHRYDDEAHGWRYRLGYIVSGRARARWEIRAYALHLIALYRVTGEVPADRPRYFADRVSGPAYLWAADRQEALRTFAAIADALRTGRLAATVWDPNEERFEGFLEG